MITRNDKIVFTLIILLAIGAFFFFKKRNAVSAAGLDSVAHRDENFKEEKKKEKKQKDAVESDPRVRIEKKWDMPSDLKEISGIAWLSEHRFACIQDEAGTIFIYNGGTNKIEKEISFGGSGDYEGIAVAGNTAYVVRSDGALFEARSFNSGKPEVMQYKTHLTSKQDVEGLCFDKGGNRLLLSVKGDEADSKDYKGIYAFSLSSKTLSKSPWIKIDSRLTGSEKKKAKVQPTDLDVHPLNGDIYVLDGPGGRLMIYNKNASLKDSYQLSESEFPQAEGLAFSPSGELFISNEGKKDAGNILKVNIKATK